MSARIAIIATRARIAAICHAPKPHHLMAAPAVEKHVAASTSCKRAPPPPPPPAGAPPTPPPPWARGAGAPRPPAGWGAAPSSGERRGGERGRVRGVAG